MPEGTFEEAEAFYYQMIERVLFRHQPHLRCCENCKNFELGPLMEENDNCKLLNLPGWNFGEVNETDICDKFEPGG